MTAADDTNPARLVLADGDRVSARGRLVRDECGTWFEPPLPVTLAYFSDPPVRPVWAGAVPVTGADLGAVDQRRERDGRTEGWATLTGTWSGGELAAGQQEPRDTGPPDRDTADIPAQRIPPGPPPEGGWPHWPRGQHQGNLGFDLGDLRETGAAVTVTTFRPSRSQAVLVVAASDVGAVEARLRPQLGPRLCVVPSQWTRHQLAAVRGQLGRHWDDWFLYGLGEMTSDQGQAYVTAHLCRMLPDLAAWAATLPPAILILRPWLVPSPG